MVLGLLYVFLSAPVVFGYESEIGLLVRSELTLEGRVDGAVRVLGGAASVKLESSARIEGELVLPSETAPKSNQMRVPVDKTAISKLSGTLSLVDRAAASAVVSGRRNQPSFALPQLEPARKPTSKRDLDIQGGRSGTELSLGARNVLMRASERELVPGAYGTLTLEAGTLRLGRPGELTRYDFQSLNLSGNSKIELLGPVVVWVSNGVRLQGAVGSPGKPQWFDLRVSSGDIRIVRGAEIHGYISATNSLVEVESFSNVFGGVCADKSRVHPGARLVAIAPNWNAQKPESSGPLFIHKAVRAGSRFGELPYELPHGYDSSLSYINETPEVVLVRSMPATGRTFQLEESQAFFLVTCAALDATGFDEARITFYRATANARAVNEVLRIALRRQQFEETLWAIARERNPREAVRMIRGSSLLLNLFMQRCLSVTSSRWQER